MELLFTPQTVQELCEGISLTPLQKKAAKEWIDIKDLMGEIMYLIQYVCHADGVISAQEKSRLHGMWDR